MDSDRKGNNPTELSILASFIAYMLYQYTFVISTNIYFIFYFFQISDAKQNRVDVSQLPYIATNNEKKKTHLIQNLFAYSFCYS